MEHMCILLMRHVHVCQNARAMSSHIGAIPTLPAKEGYNLFRLHHRFESVKRSVSSVYTYVLYCVFCVQMYTLCT